jgi:hypothetical protein
METYLWQIYPGKVALTRQCQTLDPALDPVETALTRQRRTLDPGEAALTRQCQAFNPAFDLALDSALDLVEAALTT